MDRQPEGGDPSPPGLIHLADADGFVVKLFTGQGLPERAASVTAKRLEPDSPHVVVQIGESGRLLGVVLAPASRWAPLETLDQPSMQPLALEPFDGEDVWGLPFCRAAFQEGDERESWAYPDGRGHLEFLYAGSGRMVALIVPDASVRLPPDLLPSR